MALTRTPRSRWVDEGLRALAEGGPDAVRVQALGRIIGVSKGGFYWQFTDRHDLLKAMLDAWEQQVVDDVITVVEGAGGDGRERLRRLLDLARSGDFTPLMRAELAVRDWARREDWVAQRLRGVDNRRMDYMRSLFREFCPDPDEVEMRCMLVMSIFVGGPFIAADHGPLSRADVVELAVRRLLEQGAELTSTPSRRPFGVLRDPPASRGRPRRG